METREKVHSDVWGSFLVNFDNFFFGTVHSERLLLTACLSGAVKLARTQRGEKMRSARRKFEHRAAQLWSAVVVFTHFFLLFLYNTYVY